MCGWIASTGDPSWFSGLVANNPFPRGNAPQIIRPTDPCPVIQQHAQDAPTLEIVHWGLIPHGSKDPRRHRHTCAVPAEHLMRLPHIKTLLMTSRVLIPASGFQLTPGGPWITSKGQGFMLAGISDTWQGMEGTWQTFALITCKRDATQIPVILGQRGAKMWLNGNTPPAELLVRLVPCPEHWMHLKG